MKSESGYNSIIETVASLKFVPSKRAARNLVNSIFEMVADSAFGIIGNGRPTHPRGVMVPRFGTFCTRTRKARTIQSPKTREPMDLPAAEYLAFRPGKYLKRAVTR